MVCRVSYGGATYSLRIYDSITPFERVREELAWLMAIGADTDLVVPRPIRNRAGGYITSLPERFGGSVSYSVLFDWIDGSPAAECFSMAVATEMGRMLGSLHEHSTIYSVDRRDSFVGPRYDLDWLVGPDSWWGSGRARRQLALDMVQGIERAVQIAASTMARVGNSAEVFGIIHGDMHPGNVPGTGDGYALIDLRDCALGHYLLDLAITETALERYDSSGCYVAAFEEEYCKARGLAKLSRPDIEAFKIVYGVTFLAWVLQSEIAAVREQLLPEVPYVVDQIVVAAQAAESTAD